MKKIFEKVNRTPLLAGIIGTILFIYFLQPILELIGNSIVIFYKSFSQSLYNRIFEEMAIGKPDYAFTITMIITVIILGVVLIAFLSIFTPKKEKNVKEEIKGIMKKKKEENVEPTKRTSPTFQIVFLGVFYILLLSATSLSYIKHTYIQSFEQKIRIITPYTDSLSKDKIISDFSRMKTYDDYKKIMNKIERIAENNNIELPNTITHFF